MAKTYRIIWAPIAIVDLEEILTYIAQHDSVAAAESVYAKISARIETLRFYPRRCRIVPELRNLGVREYRELVVSPYRVFFRFPEKTVQIVAALDDRRDLEELILKRLLEQ